MPVLRGAGCSCVVPPSAPAPGRTSLSMSVRSVISPSTPRSSSVCISSGSSMVQTCTCRPAAWARRTNAGVTTTSGPRLCGTCSATGPRASSRASRLLGRPRNSAASRGWADVATRPAVRRRNVRSRRPEKEPTRTRSQASRAAMNSASGATAPEALRSMLNREPGKVSNSSARVGTCSSLPMIASSTWAWVRPAISPVRSVTRSSTVSWKASSTPSLVTWTSVSRLR